MTVKNQPVNQSSQLNINGGAGEDEVYVPQYHPKAELGNIFGGNGYRDKMNNADSIVIDENASPGNETEEIDSDNRHATNILRNNDI